MATSTYMTFLMYKNDTDEYEKLLDITEFPDLGGEPELLEITTLSDGIQKYILGIQSNEGLSFSANYDLDTYTTLKGLTDEETYAVWFGGTENSGSSPTPTGDYGQFEFDGMLSVYINGGGVNEVRSMTITIAPTTAISLVD